jgi:ABC-type sugar transport system substrate-binding protein
MIAAALGVAACGSSSSSTSSTSSTSSSAAASTSPTTGNAIKNVSGIEAGTGERRATAIARGQADAGSSVTLPPETIGYLQVIGGIQSADRLENSERNIMPLLGWKMVSCNGQGEPQKEEACLSSLLSQGVQAVVGDGTPESAVASALKVAHEKKVPVVIAGGGSPGFDADYAPDETKIGEVLSNWLAEKLGTLSGTAKISLNIFPEPGQLERSNALKAKVKQDPKLKIVAESTTDEANLVQGTQQTITDQLTQNPDLSAIWFDFDTAGQAAAPVVAAKYQGKEFPNRPLLVTFHADPATLELIKSGAISAVADVPYDVSNWVATDQLAQYFARKTPLTQNPRPTYPGVGDLYSYKIITKADLPPEGEYVQPEVDVVSFFTAKWEKEFGKK